MPTQPTNDNPEALSKLNSFPITDDLKEFITDLSSDIEDEKTKRAWWDSQTDVFINLRYGIRNRKIFPWPDCANYVIPLIDADINRIKPSYASLIDVYPIVIFEPYGDMDIEAAEKREVYFDWNLKAKMDFQKNYFLGIDYVLEQGIVIWKITWKYSTRQYTVDIDLKELDEQTLAALYDSTMTDEMLTQIFIEEYSVDDSHEQNLEAVAKAVKEFRDGKSEFVLQLTETKDDQAEVVPCSLRYDVVFPTDTTDLNNARFIDYRFQMSINEMKIAMKDEKYIKYTDEEIDTWVQGYNADSMNRQRTSMTSGQPDSDMIWIHEVCCWHDINEDGIAERCIATYPDNKPEMILRFIELPYEHGRWPYVACKREINDPGYFSSRGIPALDADFQMGISTEFNQTIDNGTITNTPQVVYKENTVVNIRNVRYVPGERVAVRGSTADYETRMLGNASQGLKLQAAQYLKSWANERIGNVSAGLTNPNNVPGNGQQGQKSAKEVGLIQNLGTEIQSLDLTVFQIQMADVYYQIDALDNQFGDQEEIAFVSNGKPQKLSRKEIQGRFKYVPNGKIDNSNPALRQAKSFNLLRMFLNDPDIKQRELKRIVLDDFDVKLANKIFKTEEEKMQEAQQQMQMQEQAKQEAIKTQLGLKVAGDNLEVRKAALLAPIEGKQYAPG